MSNTFLSDILKKPFPTAAIEKQVGNSILSIHPGEIYEYGEKEGLYSTGIHQHNCYELIIVSGGHGYFKCNDREYRVSRGDILVSDPGVAHDMNVSSNQQMEFLYIYVGIQPGIEKLAVSKEESYIFKFLQSHSQIKYHCEYLLAYIDFFKSYAKSAPDILGIVSALQSLVIECIRVLSNINDILKEKKYIDTTSRVLDDALTYITFNLHRSITVKELAEHLNMSVRNLQFIFAKALNISVKAYITEYRMGQATVRLKSGYSVSSVSQTLGFNHTAQFSKLYKKVHGISPKEVRKKGGKEVEAITVSFKDE